MILNFLAQHALLIEGVSIAPPPASPPISPAPQPPGPNPIAFSATTLSALNGLVGTAIGSTTLATITCADAAMTIVVEDPVPGLTFSYVANVLTVAGTPTAPARVHRTVVSYVASDGSNSVRGSTTHEITIADPAALFVVGDCTHVSSRVGYQVSAVLCTPTLAMELDVLASTDLPMPGLTPRLWWLNEAGESSGSMQLTGTPTAAVSGTLTVTYSARVDGRVLGTSEHIIAITPAYTAPPSPPAPSPAPPAPPPSAPPSPPPAPAPSPGADPLLSSVKVLLRLDTATGLTHDEIGGTFENPSSLVTAAVGAVGEAGHFNVAGSVIRGVVAGLDGASPDLTVECMVDIGLSAWASLTAAGTDERYCPVLTVTAEDGSLLWTLGFASWLVATHTGTRRALTTVFYATTATGRVVTKGLELVNRPGRFVHLAGGRQATGYYSTFYRQATWFDGNAGRLFGTGSVAAIPASAVNRLTLGGTCQRLAFLNSEPLATSIPFVGEIDEVRGTGAIRYDTTPIIEPNPQGIPAASRVIPWPNY